MRFHVTAKKPHAGPFHEVRDLTARRKLLLLATGPVGISPAVFMVVATTLWTSTASADTLFVGIRPSAPDTRLEAQRLEQQLPALLTELGTIKGLDDVPLIRSIDGPITAETYLSRCESWEMEFCERVCGEASANQHVIGGELLASGKKRTLLLRHSDFQAKQTTFLEVPAGSAPADVANALISAIQETATATTEEAPSEDQPSDVPPGENITAEDGVGLEDDASTISKAVPWTNILENMTFEVLLREARKHGMTPNEYIEWKESGLPRSTFLRKRSGRKNRLELSASLAGLGGILQPAYAGEVQFGEEGAVQLASASYGLDSGLASDVALGLGYGFDEQLGILFGAGLQASGGYTWLHSTALDQATQYHVEEKAPTTWRPYLQLGVEWTGNPMATWHPTASVALIALRAPAVAGIAGEFPEADAMWALGPRAKLGLAYESATGLEARPSLVLGAWQGSRIQRLGDEEGPAGWPGRPPLYAGLSITLAAAGKVLGRETSPEITTIESDSQ